MDHKDPKDPNGNHYDQLDSEDRGQTFFQQGEIQPETVNAENKDYDLRSPSGGRPYRGQPGPTQSEMTERNTPLDGNSKDRGGNPLMEGILAKTVIEEAEEQEHQITDPTDPEGLGELHPTKDNQWKPGDRSDRSMGRDEMLGSVRKSADEFTNDDKDWEEVVHDFEAVGKPSTAEGKRQKEVKELEKIPTATWLEGTEHDSSTSDFPIEHLGWDVVDVVEPSKAFTEASNKYSMPIPKGITDNLHEALIKLNAWVENPEENGKLRPYKEYWSVIRPKVSQGPIQIGVEDPHMADIINDVARTDSLSSLEKEASQLGDAAAIAAGAGAVAAPIPVVGEIVTPIAETAAVGLKGLDYANKAFNFMKGALGGGKGNGADEPVGAYGQSEGEGYYSSLKTADEYALRGEENIYGQDPAKKSPLAPGTQNTLQQIQQFDPSGYTAYPSGAGEASGTRNPSGQINPQAQQPSADNQSWNDPNAANPAAEWEAPADAETQLQAAGLDKAENEAWDEYEKRVSADYLKNPKKYDSKKIQALKYSLGFLSPMWKNLTANPNAKQQTQGAPGQSQGFDYYSNQHVATYGDQLETPDSVSRLIEDPENIDPNQRPDGSNDHWDLDMKDVNEIGQSKDNRGDDLDKARRKRLFTTNEEKESTGSEALDKFVDALPLIMEFFHSEESGLNNPIIRSVHEALESEFPGYLENCTSDEDENHEHSADDYFKSKEGAAPGFETSQMTTKAPSETPRALAPQQSMGVNGTCPKCGNDMGPDNNCQQCTPDAAKAFAPAVRTNLTAIPELNTTGSMQNKNSHTSSDQQGPHTDEQQAAVAELLVEQGREDEIPNMIEHSYKYYKELAEIQRKDPMLGEDPDDLPAPPAPEAPPMPGQGMPPGMPPMGAPDPMNAPPPGAPQMMSSVKNSMLDAVIKYATDSVASKCPQCDSHTTGLISQDGDCSCKTCGHSWNDKTFQKSDGTSTDTSTTASIHFAEHFDEGDDFKEEMHSVEPSTIDSFAEPEEELEIDDSSHTWKDDDGEPLQEGEEYEIYAHDYEIPDVGRLNEIKPDALVYTIESNGGLNTTIEIDRKEADLNGYRFVPVDGPSSENPAGIEENLDGKPLPEAGSDSTDLSSPHIMTGSTKMSNQGLIEEACYWLAGLDGPEIFTEFEGMTQEEYMEQISWMSDEEIRSAIEYNYDGGWHQFVQDYDSQDPNQTFAKTAGQHYTPMQQRLLIDEYGEARNADKLNLEGTHYVESSLDDSFLFGC